MKKGNLKKERNTRIKMIRMRSGLTQKAFAESLGMSREGYQKVERGVNNLSLDVLERMKRIYGVSADYLLFGELKDTDTVWEALQNCSERTKMEVVVRLIAYFTMSDKIHFPESEFQLESFLTQKKEKGRERESEKGINIGERKRTDGTCGGNSVIL